MKKIRAFFRSFQTKIAFCLILSITFAAALSDYLIYEYSLRSGLEQTRTSLAIIAQTIASTIDADLLAQIPLNKDGIHSPAYQAVARTLKRVRNVSPSIAYIYLLKKTDRAGIYQFLLDLKTGRSAEMRPPARPGETYDVSYLSEMKEAMGGRPGADTSLTVDAWGASLSGYAPVRASDGQIVAVLGVDLAAEDIYEQRREVRRRAILILLICILVAIALALILARRVTEPIATLIAGTRYIGRGELFHEVKVPGNDEIAELAASFNRMSRDLEHHIEELRRTTAEKERMIRELEIARKIQQSFLPESAPVIPGVEIAAAMLPARMVGGDFYDFIPFESGRFGLVVGDVCGQGIPAALFMAIARTILRTSAMADPSIRETVLRTNRLIIEESRSDFFVTLFYAILDPKDFRIEYSNAGHNPPLLFRADSRTPILLKAQGMPLGIVSKAEAGVDRIELRKGDLLAIYTDGYTESVSETREQFDLERLAAVIAENRQRSAAEIIRSAQEAVRHFTKDAPQFDDMTLMIVKAL